MADSNQPEGGVAVQPQVSWQPIETAPRDGTEIVLIGYATHNAPKLRACISWWHEKESSAWLMEGWVFQSPGYIDSFEPTHWMPLPEPPTGSS